MAKAAAAPTEELLTWDHLVGYDVVAKRLDQLAANTQLPPCILVEGRAGLAKPAFVAGFFARLYCEAGTGCGVCSDCVLVKKKQHPEVLWLDPDQATIKREDADTIGEHLSLCGGGASFTTARPVYRVATVIDAERLSSAAAARLLKTFEELPSGALVVLTSSNYRQIPDTIRSRAVRVHMAPPAPEQAAAIVDKLLNARGVECSEVSVQQALHRSGGSPGLAAGMCENIAADQSLAGELDKVLHAGSAAEVVALAEDICRGRGQSLAAIVKEVEIILNRDYVKCIHNERGPTAAELRAMRQRRTLLAQLRRYAVQHKIALNAQLGVESLASFGA